MALTDAQKVVRNDTAKRMATALEGIETALGGLGSDNAAKADLTSIIATGTANATGATITAGTYFYLNGALVQAKADIASGATFTNGTNYEAVTAGGLNSLNAGLASLNSQIANIGASFNNVTAGTGITILYGGYMKIGHIVILAIQIKTTSAIAIDGILFSGIPRPNFNPYFALATGYTITNYNARIGSDNMYASTALPTDTEFSINGVYVEGF